jgi:hypothetical protein
VLRGRCVAGEGHRGGEQGEMGRFGAGAVEAGGCRER